VSIEGVLRQILPETVERMREEVIRLIPTMLYADPRSKLETVKDAFDIAVDGIIGKVAAARRNAAGAVQPIDIPRWAHRHGKV
jgi:hypothetical protein